MRDGGEQYQFHHNCNIVYWWSMPVPSNILYCFIINNQSHTAHCSGSIPTQLHYCIEKIIENGWTVPGGGGMGWYLNRWCFLREIILCHQWNRIIIYFIFQNMSVCQSVRDMGASRDWHRRNVPAPTVASPGSPTWSWVPLCSRESVIMTGESLRTFLLDYLSYLIREKIINPKLFYPL